jgi:hypothetical protein
MVTVVCLLAINRTDHKLTTPDRYLNNSLCNACGLRYAKRNKKKKEEELAAVTGQLAQTPSQATRKPNRSRTGSPVLGGRRSPTPGAPLQPMPQAAAAASSVLTPVVETTTITTMTPAVTSNAV